MLLSMEKSLKQLKHLVTEFNLPKSTFFSMKVHTFDSQFAQFHIVHCEQFRIGFLCSAATEANCCNIFAILLQLHCCHKTTYILAQVGRCNAFKFYSSITSQLFAQFKLAFGSSILENRCRFHWRRIPLASRKKIHCNGGNKVLLNFQKFFKC